MTTLREAAQAALAEMKHANKVMLSKAGIGVVDVIAIAKLEAALAEFDASLTDPTNISVHQTAEPPQPVAWMYQHDETGREVLTHQPPDCVLDLHRYNVIPLYTAPQPPADVPRLTDEEHIELMHGQVKIHYGRAVEAEVRRRCGVVG